MITLRSQGVDDAQPGHIAVDDPAVASQLLNLVLEGNSELEGASAGEILRWSEQHIAPLAELISADGTPNSSGDSHGAQRGDANAASDANANANADADADANSDAGSNAQTLSDTAGRIAVTMSMEDTVLAELAAEFAPSADLIFIDTGFHFPETLDVADQVEQRYSNRLIRVTPKLDVQQQAEMFQPELYRNDPTRCCHMRKVVPLAEGLAGYPAWVTGIKRVDAPTRANTPVLQIDRAGRLKINPLVAWTHEDINEFIESRGLIRNPLTLQGYPSIGCAPCTSKVAAGQDPRAGRWAGSDKTECGLHL